MESWCVYLINIFIYIVTVPYYIKEKYIRIHHSRSFIKKLTSKSSFIKKILFVDFKNELPKLLYKINTAYYIIWILCGICLTTSTFLKINIITTIITIALIIHSIIIVLLMFWEFTK